MTEFGFSLTLFAFKLIIYESGVIKNVCLRKTQNAAHRMRNENRQTRTSLPNIKKAQAKKRKTTELLPCRFYTNKIYVFILTQCVNLSRNLLQKNEFCAFFYFLHKTKRRCSVFSIVKV